MMRMRKRGFTACASIAALLATGLWATTSTPALAGGVSLSIRTPGLAIHAGPPGVAIAVGQPGFYGEIGIGDLPAPPSVVYARPVIIEGRAVGQPMYVHVPPGYEHHWAQHCAFYHACARPVYFVREDWYQHEYVPHYRHLEQMRRARDARVHEHEVAGEHAYEYRERVEHDRAVSRDHHDHGFDHRDAHDRGFGHHDAHADRGHEDNGHDH